MKTQIKDIVIGIFAVIGFAAVVMGFTNQTEPQQTYGTPESHVWEAITIQETSTRERLALFNKSTGEVRKHNLADLIKGKPTRLYYQVPTLNQEGEK
jgi:hypothetical protein